VTNQTSPLSAGPRRRKPNFWLRATPLQRVGVVAAALVLPCCGGAAVIGSLAGGKRPVVATAPAAPTPAAKRLAGTPAAGTTRAHGTTHPAVRKRKITKRGPVPYRTRTIRDGTLARGDTRVRTRGVAGVRTTTYEIVLAGGVEVSRRVVRSVLTRQPVTKVVAVGTRTEPATGDCDPGYTPCVSVAGDVDCAGGGGDGPAYVVGPVRVIGDDIYDLDRDGDGTACAG
jgi:resuscitation-promoting factor RpfB